MLGPQGGRDTRGTAPQTGCFSPGGQKPQIKAPFLPEALRKSLFQASPGFWKLCPHRFSLRLCVSVYPCIPVSSHDLLTRRLVIEFRTHLQLIMTLSPLITSAKTWFTNKVIFRGPKDRGIGGGRVAEAGNTLQSNKASFFCCMMEWSKLLSAVFITALCHRRGRAPLNRMGH